MNPRLCIQRGCRPKARPTAHASRLTYAGSLLLTPYFHLMVQPTGGVSATGGSWPASTASNAFCK